MGRILLHSIKILDVGINVSFGTTFYKISILALDRPREGFTVQREMLDSDFHQNNF
jgi:hypothetical protein